MVALRSVLMTSTVAPPIDAPEESRTTPRMSPVISCARVKVANQRTNTPANMRFERIAALPKRMFKNQRSGLPLRGSERSMAVADYAAVCKNKTQAKHQRDRPVFPVTWTSLRLRVYKLWKKDEVHYWIS